jgi:transcriptional regulator with PAS, ATPase and Fis domain
MVESVNTTPMSSRPIGSKLTSEACLIRIGQSLAPMSVEPMIVRLRGPKELLIGRGETNDVEVSGSVTRLSVDDQWLSSRHGRLSRRGTGDQANYLLEDTESTNGIWVNGRRLVEPHRLVHGDVIETGGTFWKFFHRATENFEELLARAYGGPGLLAETFSFEVLAQIAHLERIAPSKISIVLTGESGTGKEVTSSAIHRASGRKGTFVALNCAAIPAGLIESELFGHRKGAFTGAIAEKVGVIQEADKGTLLLDEIGDMSLEAQAKLLRVLQEGTFMRVGESASRSVDVRFIAATHRDLTSMIGSDSFRGDLYARLNGFAIHLPSLRERREDIGLLIAHFLRSLGQTEQRISHEAYRAMVLFDWPYNIRQLQKVVNTSLTLCQDEGEVLLSHLPESLRGTATLPSAAEANPGKGGKSWEGLSPEELADAIREQLKSSEGNISAVARDLDTTRKQIHRWMKRFEIDIDDYRKDGEG